MKKFSKAIAILLSILMISGLFACAFTARAEVYEEGEIVKSGDYKYCKYISDTTGEINLRILEYKGREEELKIPEQIDGCKVTAIGESVFRENKSIEKVVIPESVDQIFDFAFSECPNLTSVYFKDTNEGLGTMGKYIFRNCAKLTDVHFANRKPYNFTTNTMAGMFSGCAALTEISLPVCFTVIPNSFFEGCYSLKTVKLEGELKRIGDYAFSFCDELKNFEIPETVVSIGAGAFSYSGLEKLSISEKCEVDKLAFQGCEKFEEITVNADNQLSYGEFVGCSNLRKITFGKDVTAIPDNLLINCKKLTEVNFGDKVTSIGIGVFKGCEGLETITLPESITKIGINMFCECNRLKEITVPDSVTEIGWDAFYGCSSLNTVKLGKNLKTIGMRAFGGCAALEEITLPDGLTSIGAYAFKDCVGMKTVSIPSSVETIGLYAFGYYYDSTRTDKDAERAKLDGFKILCYHKTEGEQYAKANRFEFECCDYVEPEHPDKPENPTEPDDNSEVSVTLPKKSVTLYVGATAEVDADVKNPDDKTIYQSTDTKVAKVSSKGKITAVGKGTAAIAVVNGGVTKTMRVYVKNPYLTRGGKKISSVSVKKGKTVSVKINGKIKGINNKYTSTTKAKIISAKTASTVKIRGLKTGSTTLKIKVSGVTLKLKVKVTK